MTDKVTPSEKSGRSNSCKTKKIPCYRCQCKECVEVGPLSASTAKRLVRSKGKGSFLSATPSADSANMESARELAALSLLFDITPSSRRPVVQSQLAACASHMWDTWVVALEEERGGVLQAKARERVVAIDRAVAESIAGHRSMLGGSVGSSGGSSSGDGVSDRSDSVDGSSGTGQLLSSTGTRIPANTPPSTHLLQEAPSTRRRGLSAIAVHDELSRRHLKVRSSWSDTAHK